jgi:hypothetical protein
MEGCLDKNPILANANNVTVHQQLFFWFKNIFSTKCILLLFNSFQRLNVAYKYL